MTEVYAVLYTELKTPEVFAILNSRGYRLQRPNDKIDPSTPDFVPLVRVSPSESECIKGLLLRRAYQEATARRPHTDFRAELNMRTPQSVLFLGNPAHDVIDLESAMHQMAMVARPLIDADVSAYLVTEGRGVTLTRLFGVNPKRRIMTENAQLVLGLVDY
ncbi:MAG TPA: hypothetical protein VJC07_02925 [Candidatus Nanoarchaeia archaeon]|nr:hypothetical protein [Candidatus Nanoarchaeia archaeon]